MLTATTAPTAPRTLPTCAPPRPDEDPRAYALRVLAHVIETHGCPALDVPDDALARADQEAQRYAAQVAGPDGRASRLERHQLAVLQTFSAARHMIAAALSRRAQARAQAAQAPAQAPAQDDAPTTGGGQVAPLAPPPAGPAPPSYVDARRPDYTRPGLRQPGSALPADVF